VAAETTETACDLAANSLLDRGRPSSAFEADDRNHGRPSFAPAFSPAEPGRLTIVERSSHTGSPTVSVRLANSDWEERRSEIALRFRWGSAARSKGNDRAGSVSDAWMPALARHFEAGGWGMYPLLVCSFIALATILSRAAALAAPRVGPDRLLREIDHALEQGDVGSAVVASLHMRGAGARVARAALMEALQPIARIEAATATALLVELPRLRRGIGTLSAIAQLATLFGLLGTVRGLQCGFIGHACDAGSRAAMLARGISEAMNCTAFGLVISIVALAGAATLDGRAKRLQSELELVAVATKNRLLDHRARLLWHGARVSVDRKTYRSAA
jgi:biopolymer transport protein ExbB